VLVACLDVVEDNTRCLKHVAITCNQQQSAPEHAPTRCVLTYDSNPLAVRADDCELRLDLGALILWQLQHNTFERTLTSHRTQTGYSL